MRVAAIVTLLVLAACSKGSEWTEEQRVNAQFVIEALNAKLEATRMSNTLPTMTAAESKENRFVISKMREAYERAKMVHDDVLDKIHPEFRSLWKEKFTEGLRLRILSWESQCCELAWAEFKGQALLDEFGDWYTANRRNVRVPVSKQH